jgi:hypothetical protein
MPTYTFLNTKTEEVFDKFMSMNDKETYLESNPDLISIISAAPAIGDSVRLGVRKPDSGFNEVLSRIHSANYKSNLADKLSRR